MADQRPRPATRRERAAATRRSMLEAARDLFTAHGYAGTTVQAIADEAGVAVQTVYYTFGTKGALLREMFAFMAGRPGEPTDTADRGWVHEARTGTDPRRSLELAVVNGADLYRRFAPVMPTVLAAVHDVPDVADAWRGMLAAKRDAVREQMAHLAALGHLRSGLDVDTATDLSFAINSIEVYRLLTESCGWDHDRVVRELHARLCDLLLAEPAG